MATRNGAIGSRGQLCRTIGFLISYLVGFFMGSIIASGVMCPACTCDAPRYVSEHCHHTNNTEKFTNIDYRGVYVPPAGSIVDFEGSDYKEHVQNISKAISQEIGMIKRSMTSYVPSDEDFPKYSAVIEEIIPSFLRPRYDKQYLPYPITRSMLRQSRTIGGNGIRLQNYLKKLHFQKCTTILFLGGSVTKGHKAGGWQNAYPRFFVDWLNARYPCLTPNGTLGRHQSKLTAASATNSQEIVVNWPAVDGIRYFDLVFLEFNINDAYIPTMPHALEDKGYASNISEYRSGWYFEILLRRMLLLRKPDPVAVVTFNADYDGTMWADKSVADWAKKDAQIEARKILFRNNPEPMKSWISSLYEIPVMSASVWMLSHHTKMGMSRQFMPGNPFSTYAWHNGQKCCHPLRDGHLALSLVLAYCFVEEEKFMFYNNESMVPIEHDATMREQPKLRDPIFLSPEEERLYVKNDVVVREFDFTNPHKEVTWNQSIILNEGFSFFADNIDQDKYGLITNNVEGKSHFVLSLEGGKYGLIEISYIISYKSFGDALAWLSEPKDKQIHHLCSKKGKFGVGQRQDLDRLSGHWKEEVSIPTVMILKQRIEHGLRKNLHICLLPKEESRPWNENKFKILHVRTY